MAQISLGGDVIDISDDIIQGYKNQLDIKNISDNSGAGTPSLGLFGNDFTSYLIRNNVALKNQNDVDFGGSQIAGNSGLQNRFRQAFSNNADLFNSITGQKQVVYEPGSLSSPGGPKVLSGVAPVQQQTTRRPQQTPQPQTQTQQPTSQVSTPRTTVNTPAPLPQGNMTTGSIVDYLNSIGQNSSFASRAQMALQNGIQGYTGTAAQNTQLLAALRSQRQSSQPAQQPQTNTSGGSSGMGGAVVNGMVNGQPVNPKDLPSYSPTINQTQSTTPDYKTTEELYSEALKSEGVSEINTLKNKAEDEMKALQDKKDAESLEINNNPWYSEGKRQLELKKLESKYETKLNTLSNFAKLYDARYQDAVATAKWKATGMQEDQQFAMNLAQKKQEALDKLAEQDIRPMSVNGREVLVDLKSQKIVADLGASKVTGDGSGLTPAQINATVNSIAGAFDNEPIVKSYNTMQEGYQTLQSIGINTKSPADDIAFIYAFAKIMDPNSVVREGEYNTIQKYAQTWASNFGFTAQRIFSNTNFLTSDAKQKMLNALTPKVQTITSQYQNLKSEYDRQISDAYSGKPRQITDYSGTSGNPPDQSRNIVENALNSIGLSYDQALANVPKGKMGVVINATGQIGSIPSNEFDPAIYTQL